MTRLAATTPTLGALELWQWYVRTRGDTTQFAINLADPLEAPPGFTDVGIEFHVYFDNEPPRQFLRFVFDLHRSTGARTPLEIEIARQEGALTLKGVSLI